MKQCQQCEGFVPAKVDGVCPHCGTKMPLEIPKRGLFGRWSFGKKLTAAAGAGAMMFTMMACYGQPACPMEDKDKDGFGVCVNGGFGFQEDCDDTNFEIHPGAKDPKGDGIDQNCDGEDGDISTPSTDIP